MLKVSEVICTPDQSRVTWSHALHPEDCIERRDCAEAEKSWSVGENSGGSRSASLKGLRSEASAEGAHSQMRANESR